MLEHLYSVVCRESKVDADTNNLSILDIYETLQIDAELPEDVHLTHKAGDPLIFPLPFEITSVFYREDVSQRLEADMEARVFDPKGKHLGSFPAHMVLEKGMRRMRNRIRVPGLAVTESGIYKFEIYLKQATGFKKVYEIPLEVVVNLR